MVTASVKLTDIQMIKLRAEARRKRMTISDYMREKLLQKKQRAPRRVIIKSPISGMKVDATPGPRITLEMVKESLADHP